MSIKNLTICKKVPTLFSIIAMCLLTNSLIAGELPSHYPNAFIWSGTVEGFNNSSIIIEDKEFLIDSNLSVHRLNSYNATIRDLKSGMTVGCEIIDNKLVAVWEFPDSLKDASGPWAGNIFAQ